MGSTASGKTDLALAVAQRLSVEILVADSRQVYRGLDVGTAKPTPQMRARVPHHLIDLVDPSTRFTVADWVASARRAIAEITARGRLPLLVGGTGLYVSAIVHGHEYPSAADDLEQRARLAGELERDGLEAAVARLQSAAPDLADRVDRRNPRRVLRALERAEHGTRPHRTPYGGPVTLVGIDRPRDVLRRRIEDRARSMFAEGLLPEVRALMAAGYGADLGPMTGHGYAEAMRHLAGEWTIEQAIDVTVRRTRQYAKRQQTWFRRQLPVTWLEAGDGPADTPEIVDRALDLLRRGSEAHRLP